jgi:tRNA threonylcarbamoyladenosine biosynthesis protein TsaB
LPPDPLVLAFDTSAAHCAAALLSGDRVLAERIEDMGKGQAERLMPLLEEVLAEAGKTWRDLDAIGVGTGPGNFTGIRLSVAAARGLALSLKVNAIGVTGFEAMACGTKGPVVTSIDARRDALYVQLMDGDRAGDPSHCTLDTLPAVPTGPGPVCIGHRAEELAAHYAGKVTLPRYPLAVAIARVAALRLDEPAPRPAPLYLKPADAAPSRDAPPVILP